MIWPEKDSELDLWNLRQRLKKEFDFDLEDEDIIVTNDGITITTNQNMYSVFPIIGERSVDIANNIVYQMKKRYPELNL